jgi:hypothetical protein
VSWRRLLLSVVALPTLVLAVGCAGKAMTPAQSAASPESPATERIPFPVPAFVGALSVEEALLARRSVRAFGDASVTLAEAAQRLWAALAKVESGA